MTGCWEWTRCKTPRGYGRLGFNGRLWTAHKLFYELCFGPVPSGLELDHLCRNRWCVNPDHLEPVTHAENCRRGLVGQYNAAKTHCAKGHEYSFENTYRSPLRPSRRACRSCMRARLKARRHAQRTLRGSHDVYT